MLSSPLEKPLPRISVVICNYNYVRYVAQAIESVLQQRYAAHQLIVVDDGSTDDSRSVIQAFGDRLECVFQENGGQCAAYNAGFARCTGDIVLFLDSDDLLVPDTLDAVAKAFLSGVAKVHWRLRLIDADAVPMAQMIPAVLDSGDLSRRLAQEGVLYNSAPASGNAYSMAALKRLMPMPVDRADKTGADFFTIHGSALLGEVVALQECLGAYRVHESGASSTALMFGNSAQSGNYIERVRERGERFKRWIGERIGPDIIHARDFYDFSNEKAAFALHVLNEASYASRVEQGRRGFSRFWHAVDSRADFGLLKRGVLFAWAASVIFAPRPLAALFARWMCNPASRPRLLSKGA